MYVERRSGRGCGGHHARTRGKKKLPIREPTESVKCVNERLSCILVHWTGLHIDTSESRDLVLEADDLSRSEVVHAYVVGVVHVVLDSWE